MDWCKIGIHKYKSIKTQTAKDIVDGFNGCSIIREIKECKCGKVKIIPLNIAATKECYNEKLNWV